MDPLLYSREGKGRQVKCLLITRTLPEVAPSLNTLPLGTCGLIVIDTVPTLKIKFIYLSLWTVSLVTFFFLY